MLLRRTFLALLAVAPTLDLSMVRTPTRSIAARLFDMPRLIRPLAEVRCDEYLTRLHATGDGWLRVYSTDGAVLIQTLCQGDCYYDFSWAMPSMSALLFDADPGVGLESVSITPKDNRLEQRVLFSHVKNLV